MHKLKYTLLKEYMANISFTGCVFDVITSLRVVLEWAYAHLPFFQFFSKYQLIYYCKKIFNLTYLIKKNV